MKSKAEGAGEINPSSLTPVQVTQVEVAEVTKVMIYSEYLAPGLPQEPTHPRTSPNYLSLGQQLKDYIRDTSLVDAGTPEFLGYFQRSSMAGLTQPSGSYWDVLSRDPFSTEKSPTSLIWLKI